MGLGPVRNTIGSTKKVRCQRGSMRAQGTHVCGPAAKRLRIIRIHGIQQLSIVNSDATRRSNNTQQQTAVSRGTTRNGLLPVPTTERGGALFCSACIAPRAGETQHQSILPMSLCGEHYERTCQISSACGQGASFLRNLEFCKIYRTREYDVPSECCLLQLRNSGESHS